MGKDGAGLGFWGAMESWSVSCEKPNTLIDKRMNM